MGALPIFKTKNGRLTAYSFGCGYHERRENGDRQTMLWKEHGIYHIRSHHLGVGRLGWETAQTLTDARKEYARQIREFLTKG